jgi:osmoprotectant transport system permease protein
MLLLKRSAKIRTGGGMDILQAFFAKHGLEIFHRTHEHLFLTVLAMLGATSIALPVGILLTRCKNQRIANTIMAGAAALQTIPSLAMIALVVLLFALLLLPTVGVLPALVALMAYALLPILRNTYTGIKQVDPAVIEVSQGMGMTTRQILMQVELPLSLPIIMAGIRISTVWTVGVATLCALIGAGGLGDLILKGLRSIQFDYLIAGTVPAAILALILDWTLGFIEHWLSPHTNKVS